MEKVIEEMMTNNHYVGENMYRIDINVANDTTDSDDSNFTEKASMGSTSDTASETEWTVSVLYCIA